jgi:hypothetical protein
MSDVTTHDEELDRLRRENIRLRAQLDRQGMVRISGPECRAVWPSRTELRQLFDIIVLDRLREFKPIEFDMFTRAFSALGSIHRQPELDHTHYPWHWAAVARERAGGDITGDAFLAGALAWSDVLLTDWNLRDEGIVLVFGLNEFTGRLPVDEWRRTLAGKFAAPIDPRPRQRVGLTAPKPSILVDGRPLPDPMRFIGPGYEVDF